MFTAAELLLFLRSGFLLCGSFLGCVLHRLILPIRICDSKKSQRDSYIESVRSNVKKKMHLRGRRMITARAARAVNRGCELRMWPRRSSACRAATYPYIGNSYRQLEIDCVRRTTTQMSYLLQSAPMQ